MAKGQFTVAQMEHLNSYLPDYIAKLDAGVRGIELTRWKQATATKALASTEFEQLDLSKNSRTQWFRAHTETPSASEIIKANPLLKFSSTLSGRQLFAREMRPEIVAAAKQQVADKGTTEAGAYQIALKKMWDALNKDDKLDWEEKAEEECGDVALNQEEFGTNIHQALRGLCQGGIVGDAEMILFYAFREPQTGDLLAGTQRNFGGDELQQTYGVPWSIFADSVIPRPHIHDAHSYDSVLIATNANGTVIFPSLDLEKNPIPLPNLRQLLREYFEKCWIHRDASGSESLPVPWTMIRADPSKFYDIQKFVFPIPLQNPESLTSLQTLVLGEFLSGSEPFHFNAVGLTFSSPGSPPTAPSPLCSASNTTSAGPHEELPVSSKSPPLHVTIPTPPAEPPVERHTFTPVAPSPPKNNRKDEEVNEETAAKEDSGRKKRRGAAVEYAETHIKGKGVDGTTSGSDAPRRSSRGTKCIPAGASTSKSKPKTISTKNGPKPKYK
ncbi:hypothetical protein C8J57DRAFT_1238524 [Mycena rebaudengoi]|nr:hypothetical protein C8J57DRAFT_1238524 [Mycena rebaudengoi]